MLICPAHPCFLLTFPQTAAASPACSLSQRKPVALPPEAIAPLGKESAQYEQQTEALEETTGLIALDLHGQRYHASMGPHHGLSPFPYNPTHA
eukprot:38001-Pelagomonas_calceolata.AAC.3